MEYLGNSTDIKVTNDLEEYKYVLEVNCERVIGQHLLRYVSTLLPLTKFCTDGYGRCGDSFKPIYLIPVGIYEVPFEGAIIIVERKEIPKNDDVKELILIKSSIGLDHIDNFIESSRKYNLNNKKDQVTTRQMKKGYWTEISTLPKRNLDSVILDSDNLNKIKEDIQTFLDSEDEYLKNGIPYKRTYMLEGLPGTGKTSLIFALASHFDMDLSFINFGNNNDDIHFMEAISNMSDNSFLILEDIDCLFSNCSKSQITLPGIINVLDGLGRKPKLITFMTTNRIEELDHRLSRWGRVDYNMSFDYATKDQIKNMYNRLINNRTSDDSNDFIKKISKLKATTAMIQKFLFEYRNRPKEEILENIKELSDLCNANNSKGENMYM